MEEREKLPRGYREAQTIYLPQMTLGPPRAGKKAQRFAKPGMQQETWQ
jgi:hypothetical protein